MRRGGGKGLSASGRVLATRSDGLERGPQDDGTGGYPAEPDRDHRGPFGQGVPVRPSDHLCLAEPPASLSPDSPAWVRLSRVHPNQDNPGPRRAVLGAMARPMRRGAPGFLWMSQRRRAILRLRNACRGRPGPRRCISRGRRIAGSSGAFGGLPGSRSESRRRNGWCRSSTCEADGATSVP